MNVLIKTRRVRRTEGHSFLLSIEHSPIQVKWTGGVTGRDQFSSEISPNEFCHFNLIQFDRGEKGNEEYR
jgi:hypothetical protein